MASVRQYETDVAIVGGGGAGMAAGIEARDAGARAIAFEKSSELGGAAIISGGGCLIVGSPLQKQSGIHDAPDLAFKDWIEWGGPSADAVWGRSDRMPPAAWTEPRSELWMAQSVEDWHWASVYSY